MAFLHPLFRSVVGVGCLGIAVGGSSATAAPPDEGDCPAVTGLPGSGDDKIDAAPVPIRTGMQIRAEDLLLLRQLLPPEIWQHRGVFFHEGMSMEIGPCHRRYAVPDFYRKATEKFAGEARFDAKGNLENYTAGLPFPPERINPKADDAATRWAWNLEKRFRGAGFSGRFRIVDYPTGLGSVHTYEGTFFLVRTSGRADKSDNNYVLDEASDKNYVSGGEFKKPFDTRHLAWRQFRSRKSDQASQLADDTFVYVPTMRKVRRASTTWVDGLFLPSYSFSGDSGGGGISFGDPFGGGGAINPTASQSAAATVHVERGLSGLSLRPNAYVWRYKGERDVLAPLNVKAPGYPSHPDRNFGFSGLSLASDTWDVRRAVVIEGARRERDTTLRTVTVYVDYLTQQPLYWISRTARRRLLDVGILAHRFSGDVFDYPEWPGGKQATVFEPVSAVFYNALAGQGGWRRESFDLRSVPFPDSKRRRMTSANALMRSH